MAKATRVSARCWASMLLIGAVMVALLGCRGASTPILTVSAAASLKAAFISYARAFSSAPVRYSFAGSDQLAAQIRRGAKVDLFASANTALPEAMFRSGASEAPTVFATNRLVIAVAAHRSKVRTIAALARPGVTVAIGSASVPVGIYTRAVLSRMPRVMAAAILANVRSDEPDVTGVAAKVIQGAVDAGFVYATDVKASAGALRAIALPASLRPEVAYAVVIVRGSRHRRQAQAFVAGLRSRAGQRALTHAGFAPAPSSVPRP